jgi:hypothetical protein
MRIKRNTFKLITAFALIVGIAVITFLFIYRGFSSESLAISLPNLTISEETEEYAVYSALLEKLFVKDDVKLLVIQKQTISSVDNYFIRSIVEERIPSMKKLFPSVSEDAFHDFRSKNQQSSNLNSEFALPVKYVVTDKFKPKNDEDVAWIDSFFEKFTDARGMIRLSKVGFNKDRTEAFVFVEFVCFALCGGGNNVLLEKDSSRWKIKEQFEGWKS